MRSPRVLWSLAAIAASYAVVSVVVYLATGTFSTPWLLASLAVYGAIALVAVWQAFRDASAPGSEAPGLRLEREETLYRTAEARLVRATYSSPDGAVVRHFTVAGDATTPLSSVEARLDAASVAGPPPSSADFDRALARAGRSDPPKVSS